MWTLFVFFKISSQELRFRARYIIDFWSKIWYDIGNCRRAQTQGEITLKRHAKILLILGILILTLALAVIGIARSGRFENGCYFKYKANADNETCTVIKCIPLSKKEISVPEMIGRYRVSEIGAYAFANRTRLTAVSLPEGIETIGIGAFYECKSLQKIDIPNSITSIGSYAFYNCEELTSIVLPADILNVGTRVFEGCGKITEATVPVVAIQTLPAENITSLTVNGGNHIEHGTFKNFKNLKSITLSPYIEKVDVGAFIGCSNITSATAPADLISYIPKGKLTHIVINGGTQIAPKALQNCGFLTSITLPSSITEIGDLAFADCFRLVEIYNLSPLQIKKGALDNGGIGRYALNIYSSADVLSKTWETDDGYLFYEDGEICYLLGYIGNDTALTLPGDCNGKEYIIRESAFYLDSHITAITFSEGILQIENYAFAHCKGLTEIILPDSLVSIGEYAFCECEGLEEVSFGKDLKAIGAYAFDECNRLTQVLFRGTTDEWKAVALGNDWITYTPADEVVCTNGSVTLK